MTTKTIATSAGQASDGSKNDHEFSALIDRLVGLRDSVGDFSDAGPAGSGWKSEELIDQIAALDEAIRTLRSQRAETEALRTGYEAARLEIESLRAAQPAGARQPGAAYAALPECSAFILCKGSDVTARAWNVDQMHAFADATHTIRAESLAAAYREELDKLSQRNYELLHAPHGQAPAMPECLTCNDHGAVGNILTAEPCPDCTRKAAPAAVAEQGPVAHDEELLEQMYWEFDGQRRRTGEERLAFKGKMRSYASEFRRRSDGKMTFAQSVSDDMMNLADRLGSEYDDVDPRAWKHLLVYAPKAAPAAVAGPSEAVAYLDIGAGGYLDLGTDLTDEALSRLPKGRHALVIAGTYGIYGYTAAPTTQPAPTAQGDALSDDAVRVPLDSLHADAAYLIGRLREGSMSYARVIEIIRERIDAAKAAIRARAEQGDALDAERYRWLREGNDAKHGAAWHVAVNLYGCEWDAAIDAAIAAQGDTP